MSSRTERFKNRQRVREEEEIPTPNQPQGRLRRQFSHPTATQENRERTDQVFDETPQEEKQENDIEEQKENESPIQNINFDETSEHANTSNSDDTPVMHPQGISPEQLAAIVRALQPMMPQQRNPAQSQVFNIKPYGKIIDTSTKQGSELYGQAIKKFDPFYDGSEDHLHTFIDKVKQRAGHLNCVKIFNVTQYNASGSRSKRNIFDDYNSLTLQEVRDAATERWRTNTWLKQASYIMGTAMLNSLDQDFRSRVADHSEDYTIIEDNVACVDGSTLLKMIYTLVLPETGYSAFTLIQDLNSLNLEDYGNNIIELHKQVRRIVKRIRASKNGKKSIPDHTIVFYIMQAYEKARCDQFHTFLEQMKNDGTLELKTLIKKAECKYVDLKKAKLWDATPKDEIILALQAKTAALERQQQSKTSKKDSKSKKKRTIDKSSKKRKTRDKTSSRNSPIDRRWQYESPKPGKENKEIENVRFMFF